MTTLHYTVFSAHINFWVELFFNFLKFLVGEKYSFFVIVRKT